MNLRLHQHTKSIDPLNEVRLLWVSHSFEKLACNKGNQGCGRRLAVPQRVADVLPVSTEANFRQFKAGRLTAA